MRVFGQTITRRFWFIGPLAGMLVGFVQVSCSVAAWVEHGQSGDFYYRDWTEVTLMVFMIMIGGAIVGVPFGLILWRIEKRSDRLVRPALFIPILLAYVLFESRIVIEMEFRHQELLHEGKLIELCSYLLVGIVAAIFTSRSLKERGMPA